MRRSAIRPVEAAEFSPAPAPEQNVRSGRKTMSSGTGGIVPTVVAEPPPPPTDSGGGGVTFTAVAEVHMSAPVDEEEKLIVQASGQHVVCNSKHRSWESSRDIECSPGRHARQQAENVFGPEDRPGRYTYGGGSVPGTINGFGSGRTSGQ